MNKDIISIIGIGKKTAEKLKEQDVVTVSDFVKAVGTPEGRTAIQDATGISSESLNYWVKQADLMRIEGIDEYDAELLVTLGIRNAEDLSKADIPNLLKLIDSYYIKYPKDKKSKPSIETIMKWKKIAKELGTAIVNNPDEKAPEIILGTGEYIDTPSEFFGELSDIIINLGEGISEAQHRLDLSAIEIQKKINEDEELRNTGLMATWYTIPEASFNLKMDYAVVREDTLNSSVTPSKKILVSPMNAQYQNYFKVDQSIQSELNIKFVPIPPPSKFSAVLFVPDLKGKTLEEAKKLISAADLVLDTVSEAEGTPSEDKRTEVKDQSPEAGSEARFGDKINLSVMKKEGVIIG